MPLKYDPQLKHLVFDPSAAFDAATGFLRDEWSAQIPRVETARRQVLEQSTWREWPDRMLVEYRSQRRPSQLFLILGAARRVRNAVDRVVVLGPEAVCRAGRAVFNACCHPFHNELSRGERGGKPRLYFVDDRLDNDALQGFLDLVGHGRPAHDCLDRWAIVAVDPSTSSNLNILLQLLLAELRRSLHVDRASRVEDLLAEQVVIIAAPGKWGENPPQHGIVSAQNTLSAEEHLNVFSPGILLPASIVGVDIVRLLEGGRAMNERFQTLPPGENPALDFAAIRHLTQKNSDGDQLIWWNSALDATKDWRQSLNFSLINTAGQGSVPQGASPLVINVIAHVVRRDRLTIESRNSVGNAFCGVPELGAGPKSVARCPSFSRSRSCAPMRRRADAANQPPTFICPGWMKARWVSCFRCCCSPAQSSGSSELYSTLRLISAIAYRSGWACGRTAKRESSIPTPQSPLPTPQSPLPNPQSPLLNPQPRPVAPPYGFARRPTQSIGRDRRPPNPTHCEPNW